MNQWKGRAADTTGVYHFASRRRTDLGALGAASIGDHLHRVAAVERLEPPEHHLELELRWGRCAFLGGAAAAGGLVAGPSQAAPGTHGARMRPALLIDRRYLDEVAPANLPRPCDGAVDPLAPRHDRRVIRFRRGAVGGHVREASASGVARHGRHGSGPDERPGHKRRETVAPDDPSDGADRAEPSSHPDWCTYVVGKIQKRKKFC